MRQISRIYEVGVLIKRESFGRKCLNVRCTYRINAEIRNRELLATFRTVREPNDGRVNDREAN